MKTNMDRFCQMFTTVEPWFCQAHGAPSWIGCFTPSSIMSGHSHKTRARLAFESYSRGLGLKTTERDLLAPVFVDFKRLV